jgi:hypothetical protein
VSAYFYYKHLLDKDAIFDFVALAPGRHLFHEQWVQDTLAFWVGWVGEDVRPTPVGKQEQQAVLKLFGMHTGRRSPQHQRVQSMLHGLIRIAVDQIKEAQGCSIQAAFSALAEHPLQFIVNALPSQVTLSPQALENMYYNRGTYRRYRDTWWLVFFVVSDIAEQVLSPVSVHSPLAQASAHYHRKYGLPLITRQHVTPLNR